MLRSRTGITPPLGVIAILLGLVLPHLGAAPGSRNLSWQTALIVLGLPVVWQTMRGLISGHFAADVVATMAIVASALLGEPLAGLIVVIMQTGGEALDARAMARASDAVAALEADAPAIAHRISPDGIVDIDPEETAVGEILLVRPGELVPVDGIVVEGISLVDTSRLTGEPVPIEASPGTALLSGSLNGDGALKISVARVAGESQYSRIVDLVRDAQSSRSPLQRTADRWAVWFTPLTLAMCLLAWFISRDPQRVLAVLVVATPCPLILAVPVAIIGGINRAAKRSIIIRNGDALEVLPRVNVAVFDKTGTLTVGMPGMGTTSTIPAGQDDLLLTLAAGAERTSGHLLARVVAEAATRRGLPVLVASGTSESPGRGVVGTVDGWQVAVGSDGFVSGNLPVCADSIQVLAGSSPSLAAFVAAQRYDEPSATLCGRIDFQDRLRDDLPELFRDLTGLGIGRVLLLSGDRSSSVAGVASALGLSEYRGDLTAADKVDMVRSLKGPDSTVMMIGDGTNDAPSLGAADVGVALAGHGGGVTAEAADVVLLVDEPGRIVEAIRIADGTMRIARQSIVAGLGLSLIGMMAAVLGYVPPVVGALAQEAIDVAVILNALRASRD